MEGLEGRNHLFAVRRTEKRRVRGAWWQLKICGSRYFFDILFPLNDSSYAALVCALKLPCVSLKPFDRWRAGHALYGSPLLAERSVGRRNYLTIHSILVPILQHRKQTIYLFPLSIPWRWTECGCIFVLSSQKKGFPHYDSYFMMILIKSFAVGLNFKENFIRDYLGWKRKTTWTLLSNIN
jgi:hypothetical protein